MNAAEDSTAHEAACPTATQTSVLDTTSPVDQPPVPPPKEGAGEWPIFISYRRSAFTSEIAKWLKEELEKEPIEAVNGQIFRLNVFVDALEPVHGDFQKHLVPHLEHSRMLIVIVDVGSSTRRTSGKDYLYDELDWWARYRPRTAPVLLDTDRVSTAVLVAGNAHYGSWQKPSWLECYWTEWNAASPQRFQEEKSRLLRVLRKTIQTYGHDIHLTEVRRLRRLLRWLICIVLITAASAVGIGVLALQLQRTLTTSEIRRYGLSTNGAAFALKSEDFVAARTTLRESPQSLRNWEWKHLWYRADSSRRQWMAHPEGTRGLVFSDDGSKLFSVGHDGCLKAWETTIGRELFAVATADAPLPGDAAAHSALAELGMGAKAIPLGPLALSPNGKVLAAGTSRGGLHLWQAEDGKTLASVTDAHEKAVLATAFLTDHILLTSGEDGGLLAWDLTKSPPTSRLIHESSQPLDFCLSPDRTRLAVATSRMSESHSPTSAKLFAIDSALNLKQMRQGRISPDIVSGIVYAGDAHSLVAADYQGDLIFVPESNADPDVRAAVPARMRGTDPLLSLATTLDGKFLAAGRQDGTIVLWDAAQKRLLRVLAGDDAAVSRLCFSKDGRQLASGSIDGQIRLWSAAEESAAEQTLSFGFDVWSMSIPPDSSTFTVAGESGNILVCDAKTCAERVRGQENNRTRIDWLRYSADGKSLVSVDEAGGLAIWDAATLQETILKLPLKRRAKEAWFVSPTEIAVLFVDGALSVVNVKTPSEQREFSAQDSQPVATTCLLRPSSASSRWKWRLALARSKGPIEIRDDRGGLVTTLPDSPPDLECMATSPDGTLFSAANVDEVVCWNLARGNVILKIKQPHEKLVDVLAFSADSKRLCTGSQDSTCKIWDVAEGLCLFQSEPLNGIVLGLGFLNDGRDLLIVPCDSSLRILRTGDRD